MLYGLIGKKLSHSFSRAYFTEKFLEEHIAAEYRNFEIGNIAMLPELVRDYPDLKGLNVTIPYKVEVIPLLDDISEEAKAAGAVNVVKIEDGKLSGYNTDVPGFRDTLSAVYDRPPGGKALVLGSGGASKAVVYALETYFEFDGVEVVSRNPSHGQLSYQTVADSGLGAYSLIINTTPLGQYPDVGLRPDLPYDTLNSGHILYDLVYNPAVTAFLEEGRKRGCVTVGGMDMLIRQAELSWEIWAG